MKLLKSLTLAMFYVVSVTAGCISQATVSNGNLLSVATLKTGSSNILTSVSHMINAITPLQNQTLKGAAFFLLNGIIINQSIEDPSVGLPVAIELFFTHIVGIPLLLYDGLTSEIEYYKNPEAIPMTTGTIAFRSLLAYPICILIYWQLNNILDYFNNWYHKTNISISKPKPTKIHTQGNSTTAPQNQVCEI